MLLKLLKLISLLVFIRVVLMGEWMELACTSHCSLTVYWLVSLRVNTMSTLLVDVKTFRCFLDFFFFLSACLRQNSSQLAQHQQLSLSSMSVVREINSAPLYFLTPFCCFYLFDIWNLLHVVYYSSFMRRMIRFVNSTAPCQCRLFRVGGRGDRGASHCACATQTDGAVRRLRNSFTRSTLVLITWKLIVKCTFKNGGSEVGNDGLVELAF